uniref:Uncharacterized protein n=1 Tax=Globodera rostochiensis TaxID=31243 RepID=A0A914I8I5_GLORO
MALASNNNAIVVVADENGSESGESLLKLVDYKDDKFFAQFRELIKSSAKFNAKAIGDWALLKGCEIVDTMHKTPRHWHLLERSAELFQMGQIATNICHNSNDGQNANDVAVDDLLQTISLNGQRILAQIKAKECKTSAGGQNAKGNNELFKFGKYFKLFLAEMPEGQWKSELMELVKSAGKPLANDLLALLLLNKLNSFAENALVEGKKSANSKLFKRRAAAAVQQRRTRRQRNPTFPEILVVLSVIAMCLKWTELLLIVAFLMACYFSYWFF